MDEGREHIEKMLDILNRQRQLLEEKIATFGVPVAPHDTIALDDTNAQIAMQQARRLREKTEGTQEAGGERIDVRGSAWIWP